jgi:hypothetical protein
MKLAMALTEDKDENVASGHNIHIAVECLKEVRNTMKTKLEYLKFAKDLQ